MKIWQLWNHIFLSCVTCSSCPRWEKRWLHFTPKFFFGTILIESLLKTKDNPGKNWRVIETSIRVSGVHALSICPDFSRPLIKSFSYVVYWICPGSNKTWIQECTRKKNTKLGWPSISAKNIRKKEKTISKNILSSSFFSRVFSCKREIYTMPL